MVLTIALPIINGFKAFDSKSKPVEFYDLHPLREKPIVSDKDRIDENMRQQILAQRPELAEKLE